MLDVDDEEAIKRHWASLASRTRLPVTWDRYVRDRPVDRVVCNTRRRFARAAVRSIGILIAGGVAHAVYLKDISRLGIGFYAPLNLLPCKTITLLLPGKKPLQMRTTRCRRLGEQYYECGAKFDLSRQPAAPAHRPKPSHS
jgi:hypothetical protein